MIMTKKQFRKEVERRARQIAREESFRAKVSEQDARIRAMARRLKDLEGLIAEAMMEPEKGSIKGYYIDGRGNALQCGGTKEGTDEEHRDTDGR